MYRNLFVPLDGGPLTDKAMTESLKLARQLGAGVVGFVAEPEAPLPSVNTRLDEYYDKVERHTVVTDTHARLLLTRFELLAAEAQVPFKALHVTSDRIEESIVEEAERSEADMPLLVLH
jgi:nucleotide-binding universal stress UspA family protein